MQIALKDEASIDTCSYLRERITENLLVFLVISLRLEVVK